jgi:hypothetical protein
MTRRVPIAYRLPFARSFDARVGALLDDAGMSKRPYHRRALVGSRHISALSRTATRAMREEL